jgi:dihydroflavonol-4-reductase
VAGPAGDPATGPRVLITGGAGFVGRAILERLLARGRAVRALARSDASAAVLAGAGAEVVRGDLADPASLRAAMEGCGVVYHVAGLNGFCLPDPSELTRLNVDGTRDVVRAAAAAGVRRAASGWSSSASTRRRCRGRGAPAGRPGS